MRNLHVIKSQNNIYTLYQSEFTGFNIVLWLYKMYPLGETLRSYIGPIYITFATSCESIIIRKF